MPDIITQIYDRGSNGEYRVCRRKGENFSVFAKDELDAYTKGLQYMKEEEDAMRTFSLCATAVILCLLATITFACEARGDRYAANMKTCLAAGKNYVSEGEGYSCREAAAVPRAKEE